MAEKLQSLWRKLGIPADYARARRMPVQREAVKLVPIGRAPDDGRVIRLAPRAAAAWQRMHTAAAAEGITLLPLSGFRSVARQTRIIRHKLAAGEGLDAILRFVAAPGCSEHHTGRAIDIGSPDESAHFEAAFDRTKEFRWLRKNARRFGFHLSYPRNNVHRIGYEPWHWCWRQPEPAARCR